MDTNNALRLDVDEAAQALRISRALLYRRIKAGEIRTHKDGQRTFIALSELKRYVDARASATSTAAT